MRILIKISGFTYPFYRLERDKDVTEITFAKTFVEADCLYNIFHGIICIPYMYYSDDKDLDEEILKRSFEYNFLPYFADDIAVFKRIYDYLKIHYKYILYKRIYDLSEKYRDISLFKDLRIKYFYDLNERIRFIDKILLKILEIDPEKKFIEKDILEFLIKRYSGRYGDLLARLKIEFKKISDALENFGSLIDLYMNPFIQLYKDIKIPLTEHVEAPPPESLIYVPEGVVLKRSMAKAKTVKREVRERGPGIVTSLSSAKIRSFKENVLFVEKRFLDITSVKWFFTSPVIEMLKRYGVKLSTDPLDRLWNEYIYTLKLRKEYFNTPKILWIDPWSYIIAKEYIDAKNLLEIIIDKEKDLENICSLFGRTLALLHIKKICLGDSNPRNFLIKRIASENNKEKTDVSDIYKIYFIDLEQTSECIGINNVTWDLASLVYFTYLMSPRRSFDKTRSCMENMFREYFVTIERFGDSHLNVNVIRDRLSDPVYLTIFLSGTSLVFSPFATVKIYKAYDLLNHMKKRSE